MTFKIPDIISEVGQFFNVLMYYVRGFACTWKALRDWNPSPSELVTLNPFGMLARLTPGVTRVDEKGHEGNTAVIAGYIRWRKHGIYLS